MANQYCNKVVVNGVTKIDLTGDDVTAASVLSGKKFHLKSGEQSTGTCNYDVKSPSTADGPTVDEVISGKQFAVGGEVKTGNMKSIASLYAAVNATTGKIQGGGDTTWASVDGEWSCAPNAYVNTVAISYTKPSAADIKQGVTILGTTGTYNPSADIDVQTASATPTWSSQTIKPTEISGKTCYLSQVTVAAITKTEVDNTAGGYTLTI